MFHHQIDEAAALSATSIPDSLHLTDHLLFRHIHDGHGDRIAVLCAEETVSYEALAARVRQAASLLHREGVGPSDRVLILLPDSISFVVAFFAALTVGGVGVPVSPGLRVEDLAYMASHLRAKLCIANRQTIERVGGLFQSMGVQLIHAGETAAEPGAFEERLTAAPPWPGPTLNGDRHFAYGLFSSGTTGRPKAIFHRHSDILHCAAAYAQPVLNMTRDDRVLAVPKLHFGYALGGNLLFSFLFGGTAILFAEPTSGPLLLNRAAASRPTLLLLTPRIISELLRLDETRECLTSVRLAVSAGETLSPMLRTRWVDRVGIELLDGFGSTEVGHIFISNAPGQVVDGSAGRLLAGFEAQLVNDDGHAVTTGTVGRMLVRGPSLATEYWGDVERTRTTFRDGWLLTDDLFVRDEAGNLYVRGRADDMIKAGCGQWVSPVLMEGVIAAHAGVAECAVVGAADGDGVIRPRAFVVTSAPHAASPELAAEIAAAVAAYWPGLDYMRLADVSFLPSLPRNSAGKIERHRLKTVSLTDFSYRLLTLAGRFMRATAPLPFFLALEGSPVGPDFACAIIAGGANNGVSLLLCRPEGSAARRLAEWSELMPVIIRWRPDGLGFAAVQGKYGFLVDLHGSVRPFATEVPVRALGVDAYDRLWYLAGTEVYVAPWDDVRGAGMVARGIADLSVGLLPVAVSIVDDRAVIACWDRDGRKPRDLYRAAAARVDRVRVRTLPDVPAATWTLERRHGRRSELIAMYTTFDTGATQPVFAGSVGVGVTSPSPVLAPMLAGEAVGLLEQDECARVWLLTVAQPRALSPPGVEIFAAAVDAGRQAVAAIGAGYDQESGAATRTLFVAMKQETEWTWTELERGLNDMVGWSDRGTSLWYVHADIGAAAWELRSAVPPAGQLSDDALSFPPNPAGRRAIVSPSRVHVITGRECAEPALVPVRSWRDDDVEGVTLLQSGRLRGHVFYLQGPGRQFVGGPQPWFFHHALYGVLLRLRAEGFRVTAVNAPGAIGRGRAIREVVSGAADAAASATLRVIERVGQDDLPWALIAGSLGALQARRVLASRPDCSAAALLAPVFSIQSEALRLVRDVVGESGSESDVPTISLPLLVVQGALDEVFAPSELDKALRRSQGAGSIEIMRLADEGHIFRRMASWDNACTRMTSFIAAHLGAAENPRCASAS